MKLNIDDEFKNFLKIILNAAKQSKKRIFIVGGAVRDFYLNLPVKDYDLILEGNAIEFSSNLGAEIAVKSIHNDFGTVKLQYKDREFDLASTRLESYPCNGCLPVVDKIGVSIEKDVLRRDFKVNSMYFEIIDVDNFKLIDLTNGIDDIKSKKLSVLHDKSYLDDPTRIFRGLMFKYRFGFDFSDIDKVLINNCISCINRENMSRDRLLAVFKKSLEYPFGLVMFKEIVNKKYYKIITNSEISVDFGLIEEIIEKFCLGFAEFSQFCEDIIVLRQINTESNPDYRLFSGFNNVDLAYYYYLTKNPKVMSYLKIKDIKPILTGKDLINLGYEQGKIIGEILDKLLIYEQNNPELKLSISEEINWVKSLFPLN